MPNAVPVLRDVAEQAQSLDLLVRVKASVGPGAFWFHRADRRLVLLAGLFQPPGAAAAGAREPLRPRFTILTTQPNQLVAAVHDRMPVVIAPPAIDEWLTAEPAQAAALIRAAPDDALVATRVSKRVGSVKNDDPACLLQPDPATEKPAPVQGRLF